MGQKAERRQLLGLEPPGARTKLLLGLPWPCRLPLVSSGQPGNMAGVLCNEGYAGNMHCVGVEPESWVLASLQLVAVLG